MRCHSEPTAVRWVFEVVGADMGRAADTDLRVFGGPERQSGLDGAGSNTSHPAAVDAVCTVLLALLYLCHWQYGCKV